MSLFVRLRWALAVVCAAAGLAPAVTPASGVLASLAYGKLPIVFEAAADASQNGEYVSRGRGYSLYLKNDGAFLAFRSAAHASRTVAFQWKNAWQPRAVAEEPTGGVSNYLHGNSRSVWRAGVPHFARVRYTNLYRGIDVVYYGREGELEYDLIVHPGGNPEDIRMRVDGKLRITDGDLVLASGSGEVRHRKPYIYQMDGSRKIAVAGEYALFGPSEAGFKVTGRWDASKPLIIDPVMAYSVVYGGSSLDAARAITVDSTGNAYIAGYTLSANFTTVAAPAFGTALRGNTDAFVMKLNAAGTQVLFATYLGGSGVEYAFGIAVDSIGRMYVVGETESPDYPTFAPLRTARIGAADAFLTRLNADGQTISYSTYIGGSSVATERATAVTVDGAGNAYVTGFTSSNDLNGVVRATTDADAFITKVNAAGAAFDFTVYRGGTGAETSEAIALDAAGNIYIAGQTSSTNLAGTAFQPTNAGGTDGFVNKSTNAGASTFWAYVGGSGTDAASAIAVDSAGSVYIAGETTSTNFPVVNAYQATFGGGAKDAFATKISTTGATLLWSTYLGGTAEDTAKGIAVNSALSVYVAGDTISLNFPLLNSIKPAPTIPNWEAFVTQFAPSGTALTYSTLLGGAQNDNTFGLAVDSSGAAYVTGATFSIDFHGIPTGNQQGQAFIVKLTHSVGASAAAGDFDLSGGPDLVWQNDADGTSTVWYMTGLQNNVFQNWALLTNALGQWQIRAIADMNRDSRADLILQNTSTGQATIWFMGGPAGNQLQNWSYLAVNPMPEWRVAAVADLNSDGNMDVVWQNMTTKQSTVWYLGAQGQFLDWAWLLLNPPAGWSIAGLADLNRDGKADIVMQNDSTGQATVWYMTGAQGTQFLNWAWLQSSPTATVGWRIVGLTDFDANGYPDLVWQYNANRAATVWYMGGVNGSQLLSYSFLSTAVPGWRLVTSH